MDDARTTRDATSTTPLVAVMGVSGSGKSTVGRALAERLGVEFADADDFHSAANVTKMASGQPLDDDDRGPWLTVVAAWLAERGATGAVVACSALRRRYRDVLRAGAPDVVFLHLSGDVALVTQRVADRPGHFMPASLVSSQLESLEPLEDDERGLVVDVAGTVETIVTEFTSALSDRPGRHRAAG